jgi:hypothetical protein
MKRRGFFQTLGAALVAAKAAPAISNVALPVPPPPSIDAGPSAPEFTDKQREAMIAMEFAPVVLFSGSRGCGKSFVCPYVQWHKGHTLMVTPSRWVMEDFRAKATSRTKVVMAQGDFIEQLRGHSFQRLIVDDAHMLEAAQFLAIMNKYWRDWRKKGDAASSILLTGMPYGPSAEALRFVSRLDRCYHVHAPDFHPALAEDYQRYLDGQPVEKRDRLINGQWS